MKTNNPKKEIITLLVGYLYILLFVYAAISKLSEFEDFQIQLAQSPLLSAYAGVVSFMVIFIELLLAILLIFKSTRLIALYGSFSLMIGFSIYIYLILNFSDFIPCSCGGILEELGWIEHLIFNIAFVLLALAAIIQWARLNNQSIKKTILKALLLMVLSCSIVLVLFFSSEHIIKKENNFIRRFVPHAVSEEKAFDLKANSYYIAGIENGKIYLGNVTAPLSITTVDTALVEMQTNRIKLESADFNFQSIQLKVKQAYYYLSDGSVPVVFRGKLNDLSPVNLILIKALSLK